MSRLRSLLITPFRSFGLASVYGFLSAIVLGLSLNLFVSVRVSPPSQTCQANAKSTLASEFEELTFPPIPFSHKGS